AIVRPLAGALAPALQERPERILEGLVIPPDYATNMDAEVIVPLPDDHHPTVPAEVSRIVHARLVGEWRHARSPQAPYFLTFRHKPAPPEYVGFHDVADLLVQGDMWHPLIGLGTEKEVRRLDFAGQVVHLGIAAGTGAGKSTLNRLLLTQLAIHGVTKMIGIDVKGDSFEGSEHIPGFHLLNDIGDIHTLDGIPRMWDAIGWVANEMDQRRLGKRGPKEAWDPIFLFLEEQNEFAEMSGDFWNSVRSKDDPKTPPVFRTIRMLGFMGRSFGIRMVWAGQDMSADAVGGGNAAKGGSMRAQFGNKMLARFQPSQWDKLVGTRPRATSSDIPGRWVLVQHSGTPLSVQVVDFQPEHSAELLRYAGLELPAASGASPIPSPQNAYGSPYEINPAY
ncbi:MAG: type IV secretory system conjugative DNA transfer family protein, partial [Actinomycetes bacterium]